FDVVSAQDVLGLSLGNTTYEGYLSDLTTTYYDFFAPTNSALIEITLLRNVLDHLSLLSMGKSQQLPKYIYTTDSRPPAEIPSQFKTWIDQNPGWLSMYVSDDEIERWLQRTFTRGENVVEEILSLKDDLGVVKADLFRYLVLLLNGGVYTDTDTACIKPIEEWTREYDIAVVDPLVAALPTLARLAQPKVEEHEDEDMDEDEEPALVIALENDVLYDGGDWRQQTFARGLQIVQWTLLAKPNHPVMLDVLGRGLRKARKSRLEGISQRSENILDWTGPGVFTDAVLRYLLVRYGVLPQQISGITRPLRIGDVVIMPLHSFRADASEGDQGPFRVVWHGFFGRWKSTNSK
ncbi:hypothetical protein TREMEDRAFT_16005, partial [Tremella mesenterica DSM 1558]|uniref:uncharacterized protein n=1 Tax=Tremella mesenterica (strain ATCC 24925 / CBS 8224 / DSM 1558 / NBRC 9311 / NRRL Y-6157 / RJB 2259-6 / UBC 559-6) TaxID=578456 RepID=UPI0003F4A650